MVLYLGEFIQEKKGRVISVIDNSVLGYHNGLHLLTIGEVD